MENIKKCYKLAILLSGILLLFSCNPIEDDSDSSSLLQVVSIKGMNAEGTEGNIIESDVVKVSDTGGETILADSARATLRCTLVDPEPAAASSDFNDVLVTRYIVSYARSDGRSREGIDVPYSFEGYISQMVSVGTNQDISFTIVRAVAKAEPPLIDLKDGGGDGVLEITAKVEFYGHDMTNRNVKATGYISIFFANYVDK